MSSVNFEKFGFFLAFRRKKNFENPTKFDRVRAKNVFVLTIFQRPAAPLVDKLLTQLTIDLDWNFHRV